MSDVHDPANTDMPAFDFMVARQPIFNRKLETFGYEVLFRTCDGDNCALISNYDEATNRIIADGFALAAKGVRQDQKLTVNVGLENIISRDVLALPAGKVILEVPCTAEASPEFIAACKGLKGAGYVFLLDNFTPEAAEGKAELLRLASFIKVPVGENPGQQMARVRAGLQGWKGKLVASRLETWKAFESCKFQGFDYFQGFFFARPQELTGKRLSTHKLTRLRLLKELADDSADMDAIVRNISTDVALSVRLLHFVNSAAFAMTHRVDTLHRAASLVGTNTLRKWALAAVLSDIDPSDRGRELCYRTLHLANFLSLLGKRAPGGYTPDKLFLLGLLSHVDAFLGESMRDIVDDMPLSDDLKRALLRDESEPLSRFSVLGDSVRLDAWDTARAQLSGLNIPLPAAADLYMQAGEATGLVYQQMAGTN
ncbi:EAL and HDOD domain-containing protein [Fundidesulfovibrio agrisoli]|uniref:EAL and HDOD domain-containing protein n=1 Tax=Fundidesulfovibrio agrisoli TaxID=2922717 RepID=UPI001FAC9E7A|nr:HDOD domain-containing protein [Fundidesulfovibrio agrisoli]